MKIHSVICKYDGKNIAIEDKAKARLSKVQEKDKKKEIEDKGNDSIVK